MYIDFSRLFHQSSKDLLGGGTVKIPISTDDWPEEWKTVFYKTYPRLPKIALPEIDRRADFFETVRSRKSRRDFAPKPLEIAALSSLLKYSCGITESSAHENPRRAHPSGGGRYPIEVYPLVFSGGSELPAGLYHYNVKEHAVDVLWERAFSAQDIEKLFTYPWVKNAAFALVLTAQFGRSQDKYGERGYRYIMLEAGHIGQNILLAAEALGLKACALGGSFDQNIEKLLDIDGSTESLVYTLALGY